MAVVVVVADALLLLTVTDLPDKDDEYSDAATIGGSAGRQTGPDVLAGTAAWLVLMFRRCSNRIERITASNGSNSIAPITISKYVPSCPVPPPMVAVVVDRISLAVLSMAFLVFLRE